jgi:hypothetical protein
MRLDSTPMATPDPTRDELEAALGARRELGKDYEDAVLDSFVARLDQTIDARVEAGVAERLGPGGKLRDGGQDKGFIIALVSLGTGIPISGIAAGVTDLGGLIVAWAGIAAVNFAYAFGQRRR